MVSLNFLWKEQINIKGTKAVESETYINPDIYLYRYLGINSKGLDRIFTHNELYFASPKDFNDPFDCDPPIKFADCTDEEYMRLHRSGAEKDTEPEKAEKNALDELKNNRIKFLRKREEDFKNVLKEMSDPLGVLCLSATPYDILMWSHYADKHRGVVLIFDRKGLEKRFEHCYKVDYEDNVIDVRVLIDNLNRWYIPLLTKKSDRWHYEKEWRIITEPDNRRDKHANLRIFEFSRETLIGVIYGSNMSKHDKNRIKKCRDFNQLEARIYEAKRDNHSYTVSIDFNKWI